MSSPSTTPPPDVPIVVPVLSVNERRVLGVLVEKAKTTPDAYPMTLNGLVTGSNQKSNRDPVLDLNDLDVEEALAACQKKNLAFKITGSRVDRWKHNIYDAWKVNKVEIAILGELLLRGAQTEGELRGRASRMEPIADLDTLRTVLKSLAQRKLVVYLTPEGRRGTTLTHGFHSPRELERLRSAHPADGGDSEAPASPTEHRPESSGPRAEPARMPDLEAPLVSLQAEVAELRGQLQELRSTLANLEGELRGLKEALGT
jgi:uncharacterized protein